MEQVEKEIMVEQRLGDGVTYASIGDPDYDSKKAPNATIYNKQVTDFSEGTISADLRPYTVGADKEFYVGLINPDASAKDAIKSFNVGIKGTSWGYEVDGTWHEIAAAGDATAKEAEATDKEPDASAKDPLPAIKDKTDYTLSITVDEDGNVTANVTTGKGTKDAKTVALIGAEDKVNVKGLSGSVSLTAKNEVLRVKHVTCNQVGYEKTPLEEAYDEIVAANAHNEFYTALRRHHRDSQSAR